jgi:hypothetical protein
MIGKRERLDRYRTKQRATEENVLGNNKETLVFSFADWQLFVCQVNKSKIEDTGLDNQ